MNKTTSKYFCDLNGETMELAQAQIPMKNAEFEARFPGVKGIRFDSFCKIVSCPIGGKWADLRPVTRMIRYKKNPSLHECSGKCRGGKCGGTCECRCGGKYHGINFA